MASETVLALAGKRPVHFAFVMRVQDCYSCSWLFCVSVDCRLFLTCKPAVYCAGYCWLSLLLYCPQMLWTLCKGSASCAPIWIKSLSIDPAGILCVGKNASTSCHREASRVRCGTPLPSTAVRRHWRFLQSFNKFKNSGLNGKKRPPPFLQPRWHLFKTIKNFLLLQ